jgi:hypothetical protein
VTPLGGQELLDQTVADLLQVPIQYHIDLGYPTLEIAAEQARKVALESLFRTLLHYLMTGQVRVPAAGG